MCCVCVPADTALNLHTLSKLVAFLPCPGILFLPHQLHSPLCFRDITIWCITTMITMMTQDHMWHPCTHALMLLHIPMVGWVPTSSGHSMLFTSTERT